MKASKVMTMSRQSTIRSAITALVLATLAPTMAGCSDSGDDPGPRVGSPSPPTVSGPADTPRLSTRDDLSDVFRRAGVDGTFVLHTVSANSLVVVDRARAERAVTPASTFKVAHSLIALETTVVSDENEKIPYGGQPQEIDEWERDMGLREAIKVSNVPVFQEVARRIGVDRERDWLRRLGYGNAEVGDAVDTFWLDGSLRISAVEQALWLRRLARRELPASKEHQSTVRNMILLERIGDRTLYGKTGTAARVTPNVQWWVGWVEAGDELYTFALNLDAPTDPNAVDRIALGKELLRRLTVLPAGTS